MDFRVLGPLEVDAQGARLALGGPKQRAVLALLIAQAGVRVPMGHLIEGAYGEDAPERAHRSVHTYISNLRGELGEVIVRDGDGYVLNVERDAVDALRFEDMVAGAAENDDPAGSGEVLRTALGLWRGHPYSDVDGHTLFEAESTRLSELRVAAIEARVEADLNTGLDRELVAELDSLTREYPLHERFRAQQMLALYRAGRQGEALRAFEKTRLYLVEEMGLDPSVELRQLESRILDQDESLLLSGRPTVRAAAILVADIADPETLGELSPGERLQLISTQAAAIDHEAAAALGRVFAQRGTAVYAQFETAAQAAQAALGVGRSLGGSTTLPRIAISAGELDVGANGDLSGPPLSRAAALVAVAHSGQVLLSAEANEAIAGSGMADLVVRSLGEHRIDGLSSGELVYQLAGDLLPDRFPPLRTGEAPVALPITDHSLPGYELREQVGAGAFGVVHRAYQPSMGREVAIKIIQPELANDPEFVRRFEVEAQLVARLEHPHIVPLYDYWRSPEGAFLVMRWLRGGSLADRIAHGGLSLGEVDGMLSQLGTALDYAHRNRVAHRDIKATNVVFDDDGNAYLADFGVAHPAVSVTDLVQRDVRDLARLIDLSLADREPVQGFLETATSEDGFASVGALLEAWREATGIGGDVSVPNLTPARNPYKGLAAFGELDADDFFGRDALIDQLVATVGEQRLTAVVGPSGIGKSSVVRAGLVPAIRNGAITGSGSWLVTDMVPTAYPFEQLASSLERVSTRAPLDFEERLRADSRGLLKAIQRYLPQDATLLLVIDQFEEIFTLVPDEEERSAFLDLLVESANDSHSPVRIVLTIRADFFDRPLRYAGFGSLLRSGTVNASAPTEDELRDIITMPAAGVGVGFEPGLVDRVVNHVGGQPGTLPLMEFALTRLFEHRSTDLISGTDYDQVGGVLAALGRHAEQVFRLLDAQACDVSRQVFLRLVNVSESGRSTRRRTRLTELNRLGYSTTELAAVIDPLVGARLLTLDRDPVTRGPTLEVAHEALLTEWGRLAGWIEEQQENLLMHSRLAAAVDDWESSDRAEAYLLRAGRLSQHEAWSGDADLTLTSTERDYLDLSRDAEDERRAQRRRARRRVLAGFGVAAVVASVLAAAALVAREDAQRQRDVADERAIVAQQNADLAEQNREEADQQRLAAEQNQAEADQQRLAAEEAQLIANSERDLARARELANAALVALDEDPELTLLLAIEAATLDLDSAAVALHQGLFDHRTVHRLEVQDIGAGDEIDGAFSPDGKWLAAGGDHAVHMFNLDGADSEPVWTFNAPAEGIELRTIGFDPESSRVAVVASWASPDGVPPQAAREQLGLYGLASVDGSVRSFARYPEPEDCFVFTAAQSMAGVDFTSPVALVVGVPSAPADAPQCSSQVYLWDLDSGGLDLVAERIGVEGFRPSAISMSSDGRRLAVGGRASKVVDVASGEVVLSFPEHRHNAVLNHDGSRLLAGLGRPGFADLVLIDADTGEVISKFHTENEVHALGFMPDESRVFTGGYDSSIRVFDTTGAELTRLLGPADFPKRLQVDATGERLASFASPSDIRVWDTAEVGYEVGRLELASPRPLFNYRLGTYVGGDRIAVRHLGGTEVFDADTLESIHLHSNLEGQDAALSPDGRFMAGQLVLARNQPLPFEMIDQGGPSETDVWGSVAIVEADTGAVVKVLPGLCEVWSWWDTDDPTPTGDCGSAGPPYADFSGSIEWSPDGSLLIFEGRHHGYLVWDVFTGGLVHEHQPPPGFEPWALQPAFSPDSQLIVYGDKASDLGSFSMRVVDTATWETVATLPMPTDWDVVEFTSDGSTMIVGFIDGFVRFFDTSTWSEMGVPVEGQGFISSLSVTSDGTRVALGDGLGTFAVYDVETRAALEEYRYGIRMQDVEHLHDDQQILLVPRYQSPFLIATEPAELVPLARERLTRTYTPVECATYGLDPCPTLDQVKAGG